MPENALIAVNDLVRYYGDTCAVNNISFELGAGDILGFLGPNGAGKSTTMQILSGNLAPSEGEVRINGVDLLDKPALAKSQIGYLPEIPPLYPEMTVDEYLLYCAKLHRIPKAELAEAVKLAKSRCGLDSVARRLIANLSKGYRQRVGIAQAIIHSPRIVILDEPTVGLDPIQIREIRDLIAELGETHGVILSTHILPEVQAVCNRVQIIHQGRLVYAAAMDDMRGRQAGGQSIDSFDVMLLAPPSVAELEQQAIIEHADRISEDTFTLRTAVGTTADELAALIVDKGWKLGMIRPHEHSLEQVFVDLTLGDAAADDAGEAEEQDAA
jgi:ABC-2 type transport system ATP-binding protein